MNQGRVDSESEGEAREKVGVRVGISTRMSAKVMVM